MPSSFSIFTFLYDSLGPILLALGPEGGFLDFEIAELKALGFDICHMGHRIMRVETAVTAALAQVNGNRDWQHPSAIFFLLLF